jgi:DNA-binding CsgD family transcriptional regulator
MQTDNHKSLSKLNETELRLLKLLINGMNTSEIAKYLSMSYHETAELNRTIKQKLNVNSIKELKSLNV